jgi:hypothetical protein
MQFVSTKGWNLNFVLVEDVLAVGTLDTRVGVEIQLMLITWRFRGYNTPHFPPSQNPFRFVNISRQTGTSLNDPPEIDNSSSLCKQLISSGICSAPGYLLSAKICRFTNLLMSEVSSSKPFLCAPPKETTVTHL